nr:hypothetical protein [Tanacetum cinerariifolium]
EQNGVVERRNHTLVGAARTMLSASKLPLFFRAEAIATACYTQNRSIIIPTHDKSPYHIINDGENLDKMKEKGDLCILVGYSTQSKGYRVYNKSTRMIVESIHIRFDEIKEVSDMSVANDTSGLVPQRHKASDYENPDPEAMADSACIKAMQEELHQFDRLQESSLWIKASSKGMNRRDLPKDTSYLEIAVLRYDGDECDKGRMPTKIELTLEQSQQGVSNGVLTRHHGPSDAMHNLSQPFEFLSTETCLICHGDNMTSIDFLTSSLLILNRWQSALASDY